MFCRSQHKTVRNKVNIWSSESQKWFQIPLFSAGLQSCEQTDGHRVEPPHPPRPRAACADRCEIKTKIILQLLFSPAPAASPLGAGNWGGWRRHRFSNKTNTTPKGQHGNQTPNPPKIRNQWERRLGGGGWGKRTSAQSWELERPD